MLLNINNLKLVFRMLKGVNNIKIPPQRVHRLGIFISYY